ncbi:MAG TPA: hypothetical protein VF438_00440 [Candidatus Paceibacterota bacterium]
MSETTHTPIFDFNACLQDLRSLRMTADERARILAKILTTAPAQPGAENFLGSSQPSSAPKA